MQSTTSAPLPLRVQSFVGSIFGFVKHIRLMVILFAIALLVGISYYMFGKPLYASRSTVRLTVLGLPIHADTGRTDDTSTRVILYRALRDRLESRTMLARVARRLGFATKDDSPEEVMNAVVPIVRVGFVDADTLEVNVQSYFPEVVRGYTEAMIAEYETMAAEVRNDFRSKALDSYIKELDQIKNKLDDRMRSRLDFERENQLAQLFIEQNSLGQVPKEIVIVKEQIRQMDVIRNHLKDGGPMDTIARLSLLTSWKHQKPVEVGDLVRSTTAQGGLQPMGQDRSVDLVVQPDMVTEPEPWQKLEKRLRELEADIKRNSAIYRPGHAVMVGLTNELEEVKDKLDAELAAATQFFNLEHSRLTQKLTDLESKLPQYHEVTAKYEQFRQDYNLLQQGQAEWDKVHNQLAQTVSKIQFGEDKERVLLSFLNMEMLRDEVPISPSKMKLALIAFGLGLGMAAGIPGLLQVMDTTARRLQHIETATGVRGIGVIPQTTTKLLEEIFRSPAIDAKVPNFLLESFRIIRSSILLNPNRHGKSQVIMVTSARPSEGKTSVAANLAWAFHSVGERVLLVDCDLRRGRVSKITGVVNEPGMSKLLLGAVRENDAILDTQEPRLEVLPRGPVIAGTTDILCQEPFARLVEGWRQRYDRIILDTPPVLGLSETVSLQKMADGVVLVVRSESTRVMDVSGAAESLKKAGAHFFGILLNCVDLTKLSNYYYYYYYSPEYYEDFMPSEEGPVPAKA